MNLIYTISRKYSSKTHFYDDNKYVGNDDIKHLIRISSNNIVAWVSRYELNDPGNVTSGSRIYVSDFNMPWNYHRVTWNKGIITTLEWDIYGDHLLIADDSGTVSVWGYKDHIFNDWVCLGSKDFLGENVIAGAFFHSGRKISFLNEKKDSFLYYEQFCHTSFVPTVRAIGGTPIDGCFVISSTGMIAALLIRRDSSSSSLVTVTESIASTRYKIGVVDICYDSDGCLFIATSNGSVNVPIKCYKVQIQYVTDKNIRIKSQPLPGFFLDETSGTQRISHIKFSFREMGNSLLVAINSDSKCCIQIWDLVDGPYRFNNISSDTATSEEFKTKSWRRQGVITFDTPVTCLTTSKLQISNSKSPAFNIIVTFKDNHIRILSKTLKEESVYSFDNYWELNDKKRITDRNNMADMDITWLGNIFVVSDTLGNFYLFQLHSIPELGGPLTVSYAVTQLEYCLVTGLDWWDLAISMKPAMLEAVYERFTENFQKQPQSVQQYEYCSFLCIKASLCRILGNGNSKCCDFVFFMTLYSISVAFKSLLRPSDLSSPDKGPGESLGLVLMDSITDVDTVLVNLEAKEFTVEPSTLQSLQQLIQWVAHLSLNILSRIPDHRRTTGYDIVTDTQALNLLREILVIIRIWGLLRPSCLPIFIKNVDNFDGISTLFRLISRLLQCCQNNEMDENLIDDCCLLQNQVLIPALSSVPMEVCDIASPAFFGQSLPIQFSFGHEPENFIYEIETLNLDGGLQMTQNSDIVRHVYLGKCPLILKQCNRCEGKTHVSSNPKTAAIRSWENRWVKSCVCGGKWRYIKSIPPLYSRKPWSNVARSSFSNK